MDGLGRGVKFINAFRIGQRDTTRREIMACEKNVKLLGAWFSPYVYRVIWALKLKGVDYEYVEERLRNKSDLLLGCNPILKKVPVLIHDGKPVAESMVIVEYIDEIWDNKPIILPKDPYEKANARFWANFIEEKLSEPARRALILKGQELEKIVKQAISAIEILEQELATDGRKFFGGETIGFVDIVLGWVSLWLEVIEEAAGVKVFNSVKYPFMYKWMQNFHQFPLVKENLPPKDKLRACFQKYRGFALA